MAPLPISPYDHLRYLYTNPDLKNLASREHFIALSPTIQEIIHKTIHFSSRLEGKFEVASFRFTVNQIDSSWDGSQVRKAIDSLVSDTFQDLNSVKQEQLLDEFEIDFRIQAVAERPSKRRKLEFPEPLEKNPTLQWLKIFKRPLGDWTLDLLRSIRLW